MINEMLFELIFGPNQGYFILFLLMVLDGPIVTLIASFAASLGMFNIWAILVLSLLGNLIPDLIFFFVGMISRGPILERRLECIGLTKKRIKGLEEGLKNHAQKTIVLAKITPLLPVPAILLAGFMRIPARKFFKVSLIFNLISSIFFVTLGFYFGLAFDNLAKYLKWGQYSIFFLVIFGITGYFVYKIFLSKVKAKINKRY